MQQTGRCPNCGSPTALGQRFCGGCGGQLSTGCAYCGTPFSPGARFCPNCGAPASGGAPPAGGPQQPGWGAPQQPGWAPPPAGGPQQPGWGQPARGSQQSSNRPILMVLLVVLLIGLGGLVYWQFGDRIMGLLSSSGGGGPDATPPVISNISVTTGAISTIISWSTDDLASSQVEYGPTAEYGTTTILENDPASATSMGIVGHSVELTGLDPETEYHYRVKSKNEAGKEAVSEDRTFTTEAMPEE